MKKTTARKDCLLNRLGSGIDLTHPTLKLYQKENMNAHEYPFQSAPPKTPITHNFPRAL